MYAKMHRMYAVCCMLQLNPSEEVKAGMDHMWASLLGRFPAKRRQWGALTAAQLK